MEKLFKFLKNKNSKNCTVISDMLSNIKCLFNLVFIINNIICRTALIKFALNLNLIVTDFTFKDDLAIHLISRNFFFGFI